MPKVSIDYTKTIIYKLVHKDDLYNENIYTGHTTDFTKRKYQHKNGCNNPCHQQYNTKKYQYIRENGGWEEWLMIEIEKYPCKDKTEAVARERVIQTEMKAKLNSNIAGRPKEEWMIENYYKVLEYRKKYQENNNNKILERSKQHYQDNIEKKLNYQNNYYIINKEKINEKKKEKITCNNCGSIVGKYDMPRHKKSQKCIYNLTN